MDLLLDSQYTLFGRISRTIENLKKMGAAKLSKAIVATKLKTLESQWSLFTQQDHTLHTTMPKEDRTKDYFCQDLFTETEAAYTLQRAQLLELLEELSQGEESQSRFSEGKPEPRPDPRSRSSLPRIQLPSFSGSYLEWPAFKDLFTSLVRDDPSWTDVERFHYLSSSLTGEAALIIKRIPRAASNFVKAWELVEHHYDNQRLLVKAQFDALYSIERVSSRSAGELKRVLNFTCNAVAALASLDIPVTDNCYWIVHHTLLRLDVKTLHLWETELGNRTDLPTISELFEFLETTIRSLVVCEMAHPPLRTNSGSARKVKSHHVTSGKSTRTGCALCQGNHILCFCEAFRAKTAAERHKLITSKQLCLNCFHSHKVSDCGSTKRCQKCAAKHHTMIHDAVSSGTPLVATNVHHTTYDVEDQVDRPMAVLLGTALAQVVVGERLCTVRVLIDPGSEVSLVTESLVQRMRIPRHACSQSIIGAGTKTATAARGKVLLTLTSTQPHRRACRIPALVLPRLTSYRPKCASVTQNWPHLRDLPLADHGYTSSRPIDVLLGVDAFPKVIQEGIRLGGDDTPVAQDTIFGWILSGPCEPSRDSDTPSSVHYTVLSPPDAEQLTTLVQRFWDQEEVPTKRSTLTVDEAAAEDHFQATHSRLAGGRYQVRLPFKNEHPSFGDSYSGARRILLSLERRFVRNPELQVAYEQFMTEYLELGHMQPVLSREDDRGRPQFYLPHHGVLKGTDASTKLRVVFNGSKVPTTGLSLNEQLLVGPKLQRDLVDVLLRWRRHPIAFSADIEKMYRQIVLDPRDRDFQRILWRNNPSEPIGVYRLTTVTYGLSCAPFLALRTINQLAKDEQEHYPLGTAVLRDDTYVDDVLSGADTELAAHELQSQLIDVCKAGGFTLKKWASNNTTLLSHLEPESLATELTIPWHPKIGCSALGLKWHPALDYLSFVVKPIKAVASITKRHVLSQVSSLFDPLGWLAPVTIRAKIFVQSLWRHQLDWDTDLPPSLAASWGELQRELPSISAIRIPRWLHTSPSDRGMELHAFADASEKAYAAVVYLRITSQIGDTSVSLLGAKTKTAPLKTISVPRLELCAATLATRLVARIQDQLQLPPDAVNLWTDSTITIAWLKGEPFRWKTYVANRVSEIQTSLPQARLRHVSSADNPADCASRGITVAELLHHPLWWSGPQWLSQPTTLWPASVANFVTNEEQLPASHLHHILVDESPDLLHRFSSWDALMRTTAWCRRWILQHRGIGTPSPSRNVLSPEELEQAEVHWTKVVQHREFQKEINRISKGLPLPKTSVLSSLTPFLDDQGMLRVGGRLKHSILSPDEQHPIILPRKSYLTTLLVDRCHLKGLHGGTQSTLALIRQRYWIPQGRRVVSHHIQHCLRCIRWRATAATQQMGQLPATRVAPARPFQHSGVDYLGPLKIRTSSGRGIKSSKGYIAVFVCFSTKAIHLEVVSDYSTSKFLAAFRRFIGRRGRCDSITSDCGTNFVGADSELRRLFTASTKEHARIAAATAREGVKWKFIPPGAPHFGGLWEAAVKSVKHHLRRVLGDDTATFEELSTFVCEVEACLNSRPLQPLTDDPEDLQALTPGHFLIGGPLLALPAPTYTTEPTSRLTRWELWQQRLQHFWQRWITEYLHQLQPRRKWTTPQPQLNEGDLCLVRSETTSPMHWPLARVIAVHPGRDGLIRVATIRTASGTTKRPVVKLIVLPRHSPINSAPANM